MGWYWEKENWRTSNRRENSQFIRVGLFPVPQVLTSQVKNELRKGHIMHKEFSLPYHNLFYLDSQSISILLESFFLNLCSPSNPTSH